MLFSKAICFSSCHDINRIADVVFCNSTKPQANEKFTQLLAVRVVSVNKGKTTEVLFSQPPESVLRTTREK